jgi:hypothetical protein
MESGGVANLGASGLLVQDGAGWTPLMIAVSLKEGEDLVKLFLSKGADVNAKSEFPSYSYSRSYLLTTLLIDFAGQVPSPSPSPFPIHLS